METENPGVTDNLHSTMLLLYHRYPVVLRIRETDLHSTMLLLYRAHLLHQGSPMSIYIPLCFYFIIGRILSHVFGIKIYIPLCFYFIKCRLSSMVMQGIIYIPLCFYFINWTIDTSTLWKPFTFHYASTLSKA